MVKLDPDPVILYRSKANIGVGFQCAGLLLLGMKFKRFSLGLLQHDSSNRNTTVVSTIERTLKAVIMIIQAFRSVEILNIFNDLKSIEKRLKIKGKTNCSGLVPGPHSGSL